MSITIKQAPELLMPVYNDIVHTVDSSNKAQCSFRYICDIYVESVFVERLKLFPDPNNNGYASFKINRILEDYISYDLHNNLYGTNIFSTNQNTTKKYYLRFGEEYDNSAQCDSGTTIYDNLTTTTNYYVFNAALQFREWLQWDPDNYEMNSPLSLFLTTMPNKALITNGSQLTFNFVNNVNVAKLLVLTYDQAGNVLGTYTYTNNYSTVSNSSDKILTVGVGPENLNNSTLLSGSQPVISAQVYYYEITLIDISGNHLSETKRIDIDKKQYPFNTHRLWWLNRLGGFDSYHFDMKDSRKVDVNRTFYNKIIGNYRSGSPTNTWTYDVNNRGKTGLSVNANATETLNTNWLTEEESIWFEELFTTLEVYKSDTNKVDEFCCFNYFEVVRSSTTYHIKIPVNNVYAEFDNVFVEFGLDNEFSYLTGVYEISSYEQGFITIFLGEVCVGPGSPPSCIELGDYCYNGSVFALNFNSELEPYIIKSAYYDEKIKYRRKNINYQIEVEPAHSINIQRN